MVATTYGTNSSIRSIRNSKEDTNTVYRFKFVVCMTILTIEKRKIE